MKFHFKIQQFQTDAVERVVSVFNGQPKSEPFSYRRDKGVAAYRLEAEPVQTEMFSQQAEDDEDDDFGYRNHDLELSEKQLLENVQAVQKRNNIKISPSLVKGLGAVSLDVEMETGTGKTYVYIKTMFELYRRYGWGKFIVVVPSIAIREGVKKTFEMTAEHFRDLYDIKPRFFVYNSSYLHELDEFSKSAGIHVMIINMQAFATSLKEDGRSKESRIIYSKRDDFNSRRPIDVISANRPIVILDEPQKMGGQVTQNALKNNFKPLFSINYSATHKTSHNLVYVLDALDAFNKKLVKKIEVKGFEVKNLQGTDKYLYLQEIALDSKKPPRARLEFEVRLKNGAIKRQTHLLEAGDSLYEASNGMNQYKGLAVAEVDPLSGKVVFTSGEILQPGEVSGDVNESDKRRIQIRETIASHFDKEEKLFESGIKCLSLFFIDEVANYRQYDDDGNEILGSFGKIFEEEYQAALNERLSLFPSAYQEYLKHDVSEIHKGYFSIDKKGHAIDSSIKRGTDSSDDVSAYDLILKNKELLLSFENPVRFIFSHSALREGWDNPNVFQICTLKHSDSATTKRQEVGRGLRLCVDQTGDRQDYEALGEEVQDVNTLTVVASESYFGFVSDLQSGIHADLYERPTKASIGYFTGKVLKVGEAEVEIDERKAKMIYQYLSKNDYIDYDDNVTDKYRDAAPSGVFAPFPEELAPLGQGIHKLVQAIFDPSALKEMMNDGREPKLKSNPLNDNFYKKEFQELWERINRRYAYTVKFESKELIDKSVMALNAGLSVSTLQYTLTKGVQQGAEFNIEGTRTRTLDHAHSSAVKYDLIGNIASGATLTRRTTAEILKGLRPEKQKMFAMNPEEFIQKVIDEIKRQKAAVIVEHISYQPSAEEPYKQDIFNMSKASEEYKKAFKAKRAIQDYVFTDGMAEQSVERRFAQDLDVADEVVVYAKLPRGPKGFYIPTPVGNYSPDWAIAFKRGSVKHIFFIAETKGTMDSLQLKPIEQAKIKCAKKLFNEISTSGVKYHDVDSYQSLLNVMQSL